MWLDNHAAFEEEAFKPGYIKSSESIRIIRGFNLLINIAVYAMQTYNAGSELLSKYKFFTIWGVTFTFLTSIISQWIYPAKPKAPEEVED